MTSPFALMLLFLLGGMAGGGNDLLDAVPTEAYWKAQGIKITPEAMVWEVDAARHLDIPKLLQLLRADDDIVRDGAAVQFVAAGPVALPALREAARSNDAPLAKRSVVVIGRIEAAPRTPDVRRLMAIRTLGELKAQAALPVLRDLTGSGDFFTAEYSKAAVAAIEGKPAPARARAADIGKDVWLLAAGTRAVLRYDPAAEPAAPLGPELRLAPLPPGVPADDATGAVLQAALPLAEQIGNFRFDALTLGLSGDLGEAKGSAALILRGRYDRDHLASVLSAAKVPGRTVEGTPAFQPNQEVALLLPSDDRLVVVASPQGKALPLADVAAAVRAGRGGLGNEASMVELIRSADTAKPLWAVVQMTDAYQQALPLDGVERLTVTASRAGDAITVNVEPAGSDAARVGDVLRRVIGVVAGGGGPGATGQLLDGVAKGLKVEAGDGKVTLTTRFAFTRQDWVNTLIATLLKSRDDAP